MTTKNGNLFARFSDESNRIKRNLVVHHKLFEPRRDGTLSVQNVDGLTHPQIKTAGERVAKQRKKKLLGWAEITRDKVEEIKLTLCVDNKPWRGHAIIKGWPNERHIRLEKQKLLAYASSGVLL